MALDNKEELETTEEELVEENYLEEDEDENIYIEEDTSDSNKDDNKELVRKLIKLMLVIGIGLVAIFLVMWFISLFRTRTYSYTEVEKIMTDAAKSYFADHKKSLPKSDQKVEISVNTLVNNEYMDSLSEYLGEDTDCTGKVAVRKVDNNYVYTPYLTCGEDYSSEELYKALTKKFVTSGNGLYNINGSYVFRGETVDNYVKLDAALWRVVKITPDKKIILILDEEYIEPLPWDDRFNKNSDYNSGINEYKVSRIKEGLKQVYNNKDEDYKVLSKNDKAKMTTMDLCIGKRELNNTSKDNSTECSEVLQNQKMGLLTVSDYLNASIDQNCNKPLDESCQNYNYLAKNDDEWALVTAVKNSTDEVYIVKEGVVENTQALTYLSVKPVIALNESVMVKSGKGTKTHPYKVK
ncbi:MAG: hypothetical protein E7160_01290 [Firmicutes bacterium]|nr:hypothetical protein [Bacillota bacterium]